MIDIKAIRAAAKEDQKRDNTILLRPSTVLAMCDEIERLQKDAARYQFLRESNRITGKGLGASVKSDWLWHYDFEALDAAIDDAMESKT